MAKLFIVIHCLLGICLLVIVSLDVATAATVGRPISKGEADYWNKKRAEFYANTSFALTDDNIRLLGGKFTSTRLAHLPFWFDYELFKRTFKKGNAPTPEEDRARHHVYINTCLRTIKARALFRMLAATQDAFITSQADQFYHERNRPDMVFNQNVSAQDDSVIDYVAQLSLDRSPAVSSSGSESPLDRAVRLMRLELDQVESRNQLETYLRAFNEVDGSAIAGRLPY